MPVELESVDESRTYKPQNCSNWLEETCCHRRRWGKLARSGIVIIMRSIDTHGQI